MRFDRICRQCPCCPGGFLPNVLNGVLLASVGQGAVRGTGYLAVCWGAPRAALSFLVLGHPIYLYENDMRVNLEILNRT